MEDDFPCTIVLCQCPGLEEALLCQLPGHGVNGAWKKLVKLAEDCGIERIALENHGMQLVYNPETLLRLREAVGPMIGMNLDPSHLFWMGGDPIEAARVLGEHGAIYHIHGKDSRKQVP